MPNRARKEQIKFFVTPEEKQLIYEKMKLLNTKNMSDYLRKMAIDGYVIKKDYTDLKSLIYEINKIGININQIAKRVNETSGIYESDVKELKTEMDFIWSKLRKIIKKEIDY